jgi:hypothetical protein
MKMIGAWPTNVHDSLDGRFSEPRELAKIDEELSPAEV